MFYGLTNENKPSLQSALNTIRAIYKRTFAADMLISLDKSLGFLDDPSFIEAISAEAQDDQERSLLWRLHVLCWCAKCALNLPGDFVECGVFRGFSTGVIARYIRFHECNKSWFLYDTFSGIPHDQLNEGQENPPEFQDPGLYELVRKRFSIYPNLLVVRGRVPEVFQSICPSGVAFLHLDMNSAKAEVAALEHLFGRLVPGGYIVLDDYGWYGYREQKTAGDAFFHKMGCSVLELPTGQGLVIKPPAGSLVAG